MKMSTECNSAILRAVIKTVLTFNSQATSIELFDFIKKNKLLSKSNDISIKSIATVLTHASKSHTSYAVFKRAGFNENDELLWELNKPTIWNR